MEVLNENKVLETNEAVEEYIDIEVLSQEQKNYIMDLPESSDSESISSIVIPQRKLFTQKENLPQKKFGQLIETRETLAKLHKTTNSDKTLNVAPRNLFSQAPKTKSKPVFPAALLNISPNKTANKTKETTVTEVRGQVRTLFGNKGGTKRKNMFADFIVSDSDEDISEIQPKVFGFQRKDKPQQEPSTAYKRDTSPTSSITIENEMEDWKLLPSSTMVENQLEEMMTTGKTPLKRAKLSHLKRARLSKEGDEEIPRLNGENGGKNLEINEENDDKNLEVNEENNEEDLETNEENSEKNQKVIEENDKENSIVNEEFSVLTDEDNLETNKENDEKNLSVQECLEVNDGENLKVNEVNGEVSREVNDEENLQTDEENEQNLEGNNRDNLDINEENGEESPKDNEENREVNDEENLEIDEENLEVIEENLEVNEENIVVYKENDVENLEMNKENDKEYLTVDKENLEVNEENDGENLGITEDNDEGHQEENDNENSEQNEESDDENQEANETINDNVLEVNNAENLETNEENPNSNNINLEINEENDIENLEINEEYEEEHKKENDDENQEQNEESDDESQEVNVESDRENQEVNEVSQLDIQEEHEESDIDALQYEESDVDVQDEQEQSDKEEIEEQNEVTQQESEREESDERNQETREESDRDFDEDDQEQVETQEMASNNSSAEIEDTNENEVQIDDGDNEQIVDENVEENGTPNVSHDTTGRHRKKEHSKENSPQVILYDQTRQMESFMQKGRNTSLRRTSLMKSMNVRASLAPPNESIALSDGTRNSSAEGSGWDSHRTTRKTLRQTFGKDFSPRKSLRTLVIEKSAKRQTAFADVTSISSKVPLGNSTELPEAPNLQDELATEANHDISKRTRQTTLELYLQKIKTQNLERKMKMEENVRNTLKAPSKDILNPFKVPSKSMFSAKKTNMKQVQNKSKPKTIKSTLINFADLPPEMIEDMKYKPPKRYQPSNASWITKRLYKFFETKLEPKYDYKARVRAEKLVETLYQFAKELRRVAVAPAAAVDALKHEMARLLIVDTHYEFYQFFHDYMPREVRVKVVPDVVNKIPLPRHGIFSEILRGHTVHE
ncbi:unnamed protein product [Diatraea saccharalis]|nr:unnamed protein product [Diatraea saccharalis]